MATQSRAPSSAPVIGIVLIALVALVVVLVAGGPDRWAAAAVLMYPMGLVYEATIGPASTPPTVVAGAALMVAGGGWIALGVMLRPSLSSSAEPGVQAQPRAQ